MTIHFASWSRRGRSRTNLRPLPTQHDRRPGTAGSASDGEVEDYVVTVIPEDTPYYLYAATVDVGHGAVSEGSLPADVGEDYIVHDSRVYYRQGNECYVTDADSVGIPSDQNEYRTEIVDTRSLLSSGSMESGLPRGECALPDGTRLRRGDLYRRVSIAGRRI